MTDKKIIDAAPVITKLAERALQAKGRECSLLGEVIDLLRAAPVVGPGKPGRWLPYIVNSCGIQKHNGYVASCCNGWAINMSRHCPHCGRPMEGGSNGKGE